MARGGHIYGAGRPAVRGRIEDAKFIDIGYWRRIGLLEPGEHGSVYSKRPGGAPIDFTTHHDAIVLALAVDGRRTAQRVPIAHVPCLFGGERIWFCCPSCDGRAARLYQSGNRFQCRSCANLSYQSQRDSRRARELRRTGFFPREPTPKPTW